MPYPTRFELNNAVKYPEFIKDTFFNGYSIIYKKKGNEVQEWPGGFSNTYCMVKDNEKWALKAWVREIRDIRNRYKKISKYLAKCKLSYFTDFSYVENGLIVTDIQSNTSQYVDTFRMKWIEGTNLKDYISYNLRYPQVIEALAEKFLIMIDDLHKNKISHGDLKNENIFITDTGEIKLIDYDSLCVPEIDGEKDVCRGTMGFQHPSRVTAGIKASVKIDYFSELIIYISILAAAENRLLWDKYHVDNAEFRLLFTPEDFIMWEDAPIRHDLNLLSQRIKDLVIVLEGYLASHLYFSPFTLGPR